MPVTTLTSVELNHRPQRAMDAAIEGPVFITYYGKPAYVPLSIEEYARKFPRQFERQTYPYSVVPGGVANAAEAKFAALTDPDLNEFRYVQFGPAYAQRSHHG